MLLIFLSTDISLLISKPGPPPLPQKLNPCFPVPSLYQTKSSQGFLATFFQFFTFKKQPLNFTLCFETFWLPKWSPKASQNGANIDTGSIFFSPSFPCRFSFSFWTFFTWFSGCWTLDFAAIYSVSVGCAIFHKVGKRTNKNFPTMTNMTLKMQPEASKNASKNGAKKKHENLTI